MVGVTPKMDPLLRTSTVLLWWWHIITLREVSLTARKNIYYYLYGEFSDTTSYFAFTVPKHFLSARPPAPGHAAGFVEV